MENQRKNTYVDTNNKRRKYFLPLHSYVCSVCLVFIVGTSVRNFTYFLLLSNAFLFYFFVKRKNEVFLYCGSIRVW